MIKACDAAVEGLLGIERRCSIGEGPHRKRKERQDNLRHRSHARNGLFHRVLSVAVVAP
jgi:hypothetical protein